MRADQRRELRRHLGLTPDRQHQRRTLLHGRESHLGQARAFHRRERSRYTVQSEATPQIQRGVERRDGLGGPVAQTSGLVQMRAENSGVRTTGRKPQQVSSVRGEQDGTRRPRRPVRLEEPAESRDVGVNAVVGAGGWIFAPHGVDQLTARHDVIRAQREHGEHSSLPRRTERELLAVHRGRERAQQADAQLVLHPVSHFVAVRVQLATYRQFSSRSHPEGVQRGSPHFTQVDWAEMRGGE